MGSTVPLTVIGDVKLDEKTISIHPNDGFDLGLMTTEHKVRIHVGALRDPSTLSDDTCVHGTLHLRNEVRSGSVLVGIKTARRLGDSRNAVLHYVGSDRGGATVLVTPA